MIIIIIESKDTSIPQNQLKTAHWRQEALTTFICSCHCVCRSFKLLYSGKLTEHQNMFLRQSNSYNYVVSEIVFIKARKWEHQGFTIFFLVEIGEVRKSWNDDESLTFSGTCFFSWRFLALLFLTETTRAWDTEAQLEESKYEGSFWKWKQKKNNCLYFWERAQNQSETWMGFGFGFGFGGKGAGCSCSAGCGDRHIGDSIHSPQTKHLRTRNLALARPTTNHLIQFVLFIQNLKSLNIFLII